MKVGLAKYGCFYAYQYLWETITGIILYSLMSDLWTKTGLKLYAHVAENTFVKNNIEQSIISLVLPNSLFDGIGSKRTMVLSIAVSSFFGCVGFLYYNIHLVRIGKRRVVFTALVLTSLMLNRFRATFMVGCIVELILFGTKGRKPALAISDASPKSCCLKKRRKERNQEDSSLKRWFLRVSWTVFALHEIVWLVAIFTADRFHLIYPGTSIVKAYKWLMSAHAAYLAVQPWKTCSDSSIGAHLESLEKFNTFRGIRTLYFWQGGCSEFPSNIKMITWVVYRTLVVVCIFVQARCDEIQKLMFPYFINVPDMKVTRHPLNVHPLHTNAEVCSWIEFQYPIIVIVSMLIMVMQVYAISRRLSFITSINWRKRKYSGHLIAVILGICGFSVGLVYFFLVNYPKCTMEDRYCSRADMTAEPPNYLVFGRLFFQGDEVIHGDIYMPILVLEQYLQLGKPADFTMMMTTRYNRGTEVNWPFNIVGMWGHRQGGMRVNVLSGHLIMDFMRQGLPVIVLDSKGTGSSSGSRAIDLDVDEINIINRIGHYVKGWAWTNRKIAMGGVSYDAMGAIKVASLEQSSLDYLIALHAPISPVLHLLQVEGMVCNAFVDEYTSLVNSYEFAQTPLTHFIKHGPTEGTPAHVLLGFLFVFGRSYDAFGFWPQNYEKVKLWDLRDAVYGHVFADDVIHLMNGVDIRAYENGLTVPDYARLASTPNKIMYWGFGQCDSTAARVGEYLGRRLYSLRPSSFHKFVIGPWGHGGRRGCTSNSNSSATYSCFEHELVSDIKKYILTVERAKRKMPFSKLRQLPRITLMQYQDLLNGPQWNFDVGLNSDVHRTSFTHVISFHPMDKYQVLYLRARIERTPYIPKMLSRDLKLFWQRNDYIGIVYSAVEILLYWVSMANTKQRPPDLRSVNISDPQETTVASHRLTVYNVPLIDGNIGTLNRWTIVQHLFRTPLLLDDFEHKFADYPVHISKSLPEDVHVNGRLSLRMKILVTQHDIDRVRIERGGSSDHAAYVDFMLIAVLVTIDDNGSASYITEGRRMLGTSYYDDRCTALNAALLTESATRAWSYHSIFFRGNYIAPSVLVAKKKTGLVYDVKMYLENINVEFKKNTRLAVILMGGDEGAFRRSITETRSQIHFDKQSDFLISHNIRFITELNGSKVQPVVLEI